MVVDHTGMRETPARPDDSNREQIRALEQHVRRVAQRQGSAPTRSRRRDQPAEVVDWLLGEERER